MISTPRTLGTGWTSARSAGTSRSCPWSSLLARFSLCSSRWTPWCCREYLSTERYCIAFELTILYLGAVQVTRHRVSSPIEGTLVHRASRGWSAEGSCCGFIGHYFAPQSGSFVACSPQTFGSRRRTSKLYLAASRRPCCILLPLRKFRPLFWRWAYGRLMEALRQSRKRNPICYSRL
jgi:hypothetical protein